MTETTWRPRHREPSTNPYSGVFFSDATADLLRQWRICDDDTGPEQLMSEALRQFAVAEQGLGVSDRETDRVLVDFFDLVRSGVCVLGSPMLTNLFAGDRPLSSCAAIPVSADPATASAHGLLESYYEQNMGSGYNLTGVEDPVRTLLRLNEHAAGVEASGRCERYVGNMAHVDVRHPRVLDFIGVKVDRADIVHFNTSVNVDEQFMAAVRADSAITMSDGTKRNAADIWSRLVDAAWQCGDPGVLSLDRYNRTNALSDLHPYITTAPCAEVGLSPGEVCVFGYINLAACVKDVRDFRLDLELIGRTAECLTRVLDDAVELSLMRLPTQRSRMVAAAKRKIGIGVCGYADLLARCGIEYGDPAATAALQAALATMNYHSKVESLRLAAARGPFAAFPQSRYRTDPLLLARFGAHSDAVPQHAWDELAADVRDRGIRHVMTVALPPSGRSALLLDTTPSIEPYLSLRNRQGKLHRPLEHLRQTGVVQVGEDRVVAVDGTAAGALWGRGRQVTPLTFGTATDIDPPTHVEVVAAASDLADDGASKTVNLPVTATRDDVDAILMHSWRLGLKASSVYRAKTTR